MFGRREIKVLQSSLLDITAFFMAHIKFTLSLVKRLVLR